MDFDTARKNMVKNQVMPSDVTNKRLLNAMFEIPREKFVPPENIAHAYNEIAIPAACEREIIESRFLGKMIDTFDPNPNELIFTCGWGGDRTTADRRGVGAAPQRTCFYSATPLYLRAVTWGCSPEPSCNNPHAWLRGAGNLRMKC